jgi:signal transduction histidine kinase
LASRSEAVDHLVVNTEFHLDETVVDRFDLEFESTVYRVVQEALRNAAKHARATNVSITVAEDGGYLTVAVRDDGRGLDGNLKSGADAGFGIRGMEERARLIHGELVIAAGPSGGVVVRLIAPLPGNAQTSEQNPDHPIEDVHRRSTPKAEPPSTPSAGGAET